VRFWTTSPPWPSLSQTAYGLRSGTCRGHALPFRSGIAPGTLPVDGPARTTYLVVAEFLLSYSFLKAWAG
jgi:hypothetical protein